MRSMVLQALLLPRFLALGFRLFGVPRTKAALGIWTSKRPAPIPSEVPSTIRAAFQAQRLTRPYTGGGTCLVKSLTLWSMLAHCGIQTELRIGVRRHEGRIEGHAWLEYEGLPINETPEITATYVLFEGAAKLDTLSSMK